MCVAWAVLGARLRGPERRDVLGVPPFAFAPRKAPVDFGSPSPGGSLPLPGDMVGRVARVRPAAWGR